MRALVAQCIAGFDAALDDNLNVPNALAALFEFVTALNQREASLSPGDAAEALAGLHHADDVLAVLDRRVRSGLVTKSEIEAMLAAGTPPEEPLAAPLEPDAIIRAIARRQAAKDGRDFASADAIRQSLKDAGASIEDLPAGVRFKI